MTRKYERKKKAFYKIVAKAIVEGAPFDISKDNGGFKKVQELVTLYMLRELNDAAKYKIWNDYSAKVERIFNAAIHYINDNPDELPGLENLHVHKHHPTGKRNNEFLSLKVGYRKARDRNTDRLIRRIETVVRPAVAEIRKTQPERLSEGQERTQKLLTD